MSHVTSVKLADLIKLTQLIEEQVAPAFDETNPQLAQARQQHLGDLGLDELNLLRNHLIDQIPVHRTSSTDEFIKISPEFSPLLGSSIDFVYASTTDQGIKDWLDEHALFKTLPRYQAIIEAQKSRALKRRAQLFGSRYQAPVKSLMIPISDQRLGESNSTKAIVNRVFNKEFRNVPHDDIIAVNYALERAGSNLKTMGIIIAYKKKNEKSPKIDRTLSSSDPISTKYYPKILAESYRQLGREKGLTLHKPLYGVESIQIDLPVLGRTTVYYYRFAVNPLHTLNEALPWGLLQRTYTVYRIKKNLAAIDPSKLANPDLEIFTKAQRSIADIHRQFEALHIDSQVLKSAGDKSIAAASGNLTIKFTPQEATAVRILLETVVREEWYNERKRLTHSKARLGIESTIETLREYERISSTPLQAARETTISPSQKAPQIIPITTLALLNEDPHNFIRAAARQLSRSEHPMSYDEIFFALTKGPGDPAYERFASYMGNSRSEFEKFAAKHRRLGTLEKLETKRKSSKPKK